MTADRLLAELEPLIPGMWHRGEKLEFEAAFREKVNAALDDFGKTAADKRQQDIIQALMQYAGWTEEIDLAFLMVAKDPKRNLRLHIGRRLMSFIDRVPKT